MNWLIDLPTLHYSLQSHRLQHYPPKNPAFDRVASHHKDQRTKAWSRPVAGAECIGVGLDRNRGVSFCTLSTCTNKRVMT